jgi:predicted nucleic acid-binding protein
MPGSFFDTNILLYAVSGDAAKADRADELIDAGGTVNIQVLNELANVTRRKMGMTWTETHEFLALIRGLLDVQAVTIDIHETGLALAEPYGLSTFDAMIVAAALHANCDTLWSEDMQHGMTIDNRLRIVNPFGSK